MASLSLPGKTGPIITVFRLLGLAFSGESLGFSIQFDFATNWMTSRMMAATLEMHHTGCEPGVRAEIVNAA